jgi:FMN-dependent NADH-azoreductase
MPYQSPKNILKVNSSGRVNGSHSRVLVEELVNRLLSKHASANVVTREVSSGLEFVDESWIHANFTNPAERSEVQKNRLNASDSLVEEVENADILVIAAPIYNFGVPAALKAWIDQICRANRTFKYSETGPVGLLEGKKAYVIVTSGGTKAQSSVDYASDYMRHVLGFIGIKDVEIIAADQLMMAEEKQLAQARALIAAA